MTDSEHDDIKGFRHDLVSAIDEAVILAPTEPEKSLRLLDSAMKNIQQIAQRLYEVQQRDLLTGGRHRE